MSNNNTPNIETNAIYQGPTGGTAGIRVGIAVTDTVGLYGVTPVAQRSGSAQAAVATTAITAPATTASTSTTPYGYTSTQANAITVAVDALVTRVAANTTLLNELRAALVALGAIKGAA